MIAGVGTDVAERTADGRTSDYPAASNAAQVLTAAYPTTAAARNIGGWNRERRRDIRLRFSARARSVTISLPDIGFSVGLPVMQEGLVVA